MSELRRSPWVATSVALLWMVIVGLSGTGCRKRTPPSPQASHSAVANAPQSPLEDANVLVYVDSRPPGAAIRRESTKSVMGYTPETVQLRRSSEPVPIRLELEGYVPVDRALSAASDHQVMVVLQPEAKQGAATSR